MEKYRPFADPGTGVNPFVPPWSHYKAPLIAKAVKGLVMLPVALLRLTLFSVAMVWLLLAEFICMLIPLGFLRYPVYRIFSYIGCGIALLALGVFPTGDEIADYRRLKIPPPKTGGAQVFNASRGCLILVNQQGLTDVLLLGMKVCPTFVFPASDGSPVRYSLLGALRRAGARRQAAPPKQPTKLSDIADAAKSGWCGPVAVFPEGARTNGSCVLSWKPRTFQGMESFEKPVGAAIMSVTYSKTGAYTAHHTVGTTFKHILWLCCQPWQTVTTVWLPPSDVSASVKTLAAGKPLPEVTALLRTLMVRMIKDSVEVEVGADKHMDFMAFWDASQKKGYTHQQKKKS